MATRYSISIAVILASTCEWAAGLQHSIRNISSQLAREQPYPIEGTETSSHCEYFTVKCPGGDKRISGNMVMLGDKGLWCPNAKIGTTTVYDVLTKVNDWPADEDGRIRRCYPAPPGSHVQECWYENEMRSAAAMVHRDVAEEMCSAYTFTFIRNPWDRVRSAYNGKIATGRIMVDGRTDMTFAEFVRFVAKQDPADMNYHWRPVSQVCLTAAQEPAKYDKIYRLEDGFNSNLAEALEQIGWEVDEITAQNQKTDPSVEERISNYTQAEGIKNKHELVEIVKKVYKEDIELGGYTFEEYA